MSVDQYSEEGELVDSADLYEKFERQVENIGDGSGEYIWPRQQRQDGKWFGFNQAILAKKRAQYLDKTQFRAQYYNDPNAVDEAPIRPESFQYYDENMMKYKNGAWHYKDRKLNVFAAIDFAYTLNKKSDYTCVIVVGVDYEFNYYILDIQRLQTNRIQEYFNAILRAFEKFHFRKIRAEVTAAQEVIVKDLKENYIRPYGLALAVEDFRPTRNEGTKQERVYAVLQPRYDNLQIWHYKGGNIQLLEEELISTNPPHDDLKDTLSSVIETCVAPSKKTHGTKITETRQVFNNRFGGIG